MKICPKYYCCAVVFSALAAHASATTQEASFLNIFYFEHAVMAAADCESRGFPSRPIHADWLRTNKPIHDRVTESLRGELVRTGVTQQDVPQLLTSIHEYYREKLLEKVRLSDKICGNFRRYLRSLHSLPDSLYEEPSSDRPQ